MICGNCGFQNKPGDEFCGSCGQFLAWTGNPADQPDASMESRLAGSAGGPPPPVTPGAMPPDFPTVVVPPPGSPPPAAAINWPAGLQRCDVCGTANELSRTFCLNCGSKLKRAGTTSGAALAVAAAQAERRRGMRMVGYAVLGVFLFVVAAAVAFVAFGGLAPAASAPPATPASSLIAANPSASSAAPESPPVSPGATGSEQPPATSVASEPPATAEPSSPIVSAPPDTAPPTTTPPATLSPATTPPAGGFACAASTFGATQPGGWKILRAHWSRKGTADTLTLEIEPADSTSTADVDANILPPDQVQTTYGVPGPTSGDVAVVLAFNDAVGLSTPFGSSVGYKTLQEFQIYRNAGTVFLVMGANGAGCYGLASDAWTTGSSSAPELTISLQR